MQVLTFFQKGAKDHHRKTSMSGDVPQKFQACPIELSIEGRSLQRRERFGQSKYFAKIYVKNSGSTDFQELAKTEVFAAENCPVFTSKAWLCPFDMADSQMEAVKTIIRVTFHSNSFFLGSAQTSAAELFWDGCQELELKGGKQGKEKDQKTFKPTAILSANAFTRSVNTAAAHDIELSLSVSKMLLSDVKESKVFFAVARAGDKGTWAGVYRSEALRKHSRSDRTQFTKAVMNREELTGNNLHRMLRIGLYGYRHGHHALHGFAQFKLADLAALESGAPVNGQKIAWTQARYSTLNAELELRSWSYTAEKTEVHLGLVRADDPQQARQVAAKTSNSWSGSRVFGRPKIRGTPPVPPKTFHGPGNLLRFVPSQGSHRSNSASASNETPSQVETVRFPEDYDYGSGSDFESESDSAIERNDSEAEATILQTEVSASGSSSTNSSS